MSTFILKHKKCDLYAAERGVLGCRREPRIEEAMQMTRAEWDAALAPDALVHLELLPLCTQCDDDGEVTLATDGNLCAAHHDSAGERQDARDAEGI